MIDTNHAQKLYGEMLKVLSINNSYQKNYILLKLMLEIKFAIINKRKKYELFSHNKAVDLKKKTSENVLVIRVDREKDKTIRNFIYCVVKNN